MNTGVKRPIKITFPFGLYFRQLFSADNYVKLLNPFSFWRRYRINHLETCRELDTVQYLENCFQIEWRSARSCKLQRNKGYLDSSTYALFVPADGNSMIIAQRSIQLKYRGVTYHTRDIANINIDCQKIDPSEVKPNSIKQSSSSDFSDTTKKSGSN